MQQPTQRNSNSMQVKGVHKQRPIMCIRQRTASHKFFEEWDELVYHLTNPFSRGTVHRTGGATSINSYVFLYVKGRVISVVIWTLVVTLTHSTESSKLVRCRCVSGHPMFCELLLFDLCLGLESPWPWCTCSVLPMAALRIWTPLPFLTTCFLTIRLATRYMYSTTVEGLILYSWSRRIWNVPWA